MKKFLLSLSLVPLLWSALGSTVVAQVKGVSPLPTQQQLSLLGLERAWWAQAVINPSRDKVQYLVIDENTIYVQISSGVTTAFDAETGRKKWATQIGRFDQASFPAVSNEEVALFVTGTMMHALDKDSGEIVWSLQLPAAPSTAPSLDEKQIYFGTLDGSLYAYSLRKIRDLYQQRKLPQWSQHALVWRFKTGKEITSPAILSGRAVNFASRDGSLYSVGSADRKLIYQLETDKAISAPLARLDDQMFMASEDNSFYALDLLSGKIRWEFTSPLPIRKTIWAINNDLFLLPDRGGMICLDPHDGARRWAQPYLSNLIAVLGDSLAASDVDGNLVMVDRIKGETIGAIPLRRFTIRTGNDRTDRAYMATESGLVVCLRKIGQIDPVYLRYPDRLPLMPEFEPEEGSQPPKESDEPMTEESTEESTEEK